MLYLGKIRRQMGKAKKRIIFKHIEAIKMLACKHWKFAVDSQSVGFSLHMPSEMPA